MKLMKSKAAVNWVHALYIFLFLCCSKSPTGPDSLVGQSVQLSPAFPNLSFSSPVLLTHSGDGTNRIFVVEQPGVIRVFANDTTTQTTDTFLDITGRLTSGGEMGLLGLAFHPDFENNGLFYVDYTTTQNGPRRTVISEFSASGNLADAGSERILLEINQFAANHNGGMLEFGPDGYLYIALGDGGNSNDSGNNGQNRTTLLATILRIDVNNQADTLQYAIPPSNPFVGEGNGVREEIFAYGLRNPWRFSIDQQTGQLWVGDVGQKRQEEIDIIVSGSNYGWPIMEGFECFNRNNSDNPLPNCDQTGLTLPLIDYDHGLGCSVSGGYVYRGSRLPALTGAYVYGDYCTGRIWLLRYENGSVTADSLLLDTNLAISSFGTDEIGELYVCDIDAGRIYHFTAPTITSVSDDETQPKKFALKQNYPNPFNPETNIEYSVPKANIVELSVFNTKGQKIRTLFRGKKDAGTYSISWDGKTDLGQTVASGVYIYRIKVGDHIQTKGMTLAK